MKGDFHVRFWSSRLVSNSYLCAIRLLKDWKISHKTGLAEMPS
jgi:hypothetical protein